MTKVYLKYYGKISRCSYFIYMYVTKCLYNNTRNNKCRGMRDMEEHTPSGSGDSHACMGGLRATRYTPAGTRKVDASHGRVSRDKVYPYGHAQS